jgi:polygalacturonase
VAVDGVWTRVEVRYGVEEALGLRAPLGFALAGDYLVVAGPTYGKGGVSLLSAMHWNATGGCLGRGGEALGDYLVGVRPPLFPNQHSNIGCLGRG